MKLGIKPTISGMYNMPKSQSNNQNFDLHQEAEILTSQLNLSTEEVSKLKVHKKG